MYLLVFACLCHLLFLLRWDNFRLVFKVINNRRHLLFIQVACFFECWRNLVHYIGLCHTVLILYLLTVRNLLQLSRPRILLALWITIIGLILVWLIFDNSRHSWSWCRVEAKTIVTNAFFEWCLVWSIFISLPVLVNLARLTVIWYRFIQFESLVFGDL